MGRRGCTVEEDTWLAVGPTIQSFGAGHDGWLMTVRWVTIVAIERGRKRDIAGRYTIERENGTKTYHYPGYLLCGCVRLW